MPTSQSFSALLDAARAGDQDALSILLGQAALRLRQVIRADLPRRWQALLTADDVFQQTCVDAFCHIGAFAGSTAVAFEAWLVRIAHRNQIDAVRMLDAEKRGGGRPVRECDGPDGAALDLLLHLSEQPTPSVVVGRREALATVQRLVATLPDSYRAVIQGYDLAELPMEQVADGLGRSRGAAYMLRARGLALLRERIGDTAHFFSTAS